MAKKLLRARESFFIATKTGYARQINQGEVLEVDDPIVKGREIYFTELSIGDVTVEQATAAPGERRAVTPPKKKG